VVARVGGEEITAAELDASLRFRLHDLDQARHTLREQRLEELVNQRLGRPAGADLSAARRAGDVQILLAAPEPLRTELDLAGARLRGDPEGRVTIVEFVDFQSPYSRRIQPILRRILEEYQGSVRLAVRDLPLPFHRQARLAAEAAACAGEQDAYWDYHDLLLREQARLERSELERYATRLGLDGEAFRSCLASGRFAAKVSADLKIARRMGLSVVPTLFVNGIYLKGPQSYADLARIVEGELGEQFDGASDTEAPDDPDPAALRNARLSELPLVLFATLVSESPAPALAGIRVLGENRSSLYRVGEEVMEGVELIAVERGRAFLRRGNAVEYLVLQDSSGEGGPALEPPRVPLDLLPEPDAVITLRRAWVSGALAKRGVLEARLEPGRGVHDGHRLLKLGEVEPGDLYEGLGLEAGDLIMLVDGEWLTDRQNPLWEALETRDAITLVFVRRGRYLSHRYVIE
jgi:2-hydroxychromene-2-carboxylate isomerase